MALYCCRQLKISKFCVTKFLQRGSDMLLALWKYLLQSTSFTYTVLPDAKTAVTGDATPKKIVVFEY